MMDVEHDCISHIRQAAVEAAGNTRCPEIHTTSENCITRGSREQVPNQATPSLVTKTITPPAINLLPSIPTSIQAD